MELAVALVSAVTTMELIRCRGWMSISSCIDFSLYGTSASTASIADNAAASELPVDFTMISGELDVMSPETVVVVAGCCFSRKSWTSLLLRLRTRTSREFVSVSR